MSHGHDTHAAADVERLTNAQAGKLKMMAGAVALVGIVLCAIAAFTDSKRFAFSYLTGFAFVLTIGLGALFFVLVQHLTRAGWSVAARRQMEWMSTILPVCAILFIPVIVYSHDLFHHWMGPDAATDEILKKKAPYLNTSFFYTRAAIYFVIWTGLSLFFWRTSRRQDDVDGGDPKLTLRMQALSAPGMLLFGLSLTFASFDWLMSLDPHWYSTIFGVYIFAGSECAALAALALMTLVLQEKHFFNKVSTVEHRHDIGKLLFGFICFWTYIAFSQFFLIWYANIPEETIFFRHRLEHGWDTWSMLLMIGHFPVPFAMLLSRTAKRNTFLLAISAVWILFIHYVDLYWLVMPVQGGLHFSWIDVAGLLGPLGVFLLWVALRAGSEPLFPIRDPRLLETYRVDNP